jgi:Zinc-binding dehydrogenase
LVDAGKLRVNLDRVFLLEEAAEAQRVVQAGEFTGRVVIDMHAKGGGLRMADGSRSDSASITSFTPFFPCPFYLLRPPRQH